MRSPLAYFATAVLAAAACAPRTDTAGAPPAPADRVPAIELARDPSWRDCGLTPGDPSGVCVDFSGAVVVADASPPRLISYGTGGACREFQAPAGRPAFRPSDVSVRGFFIYAVDEANRLLLRWDSSGAFRDVLLDFDAFDDRRRISPYAVDVDASGRAAVSDVENHQVLVLDTYLRVDVAFGNYGSFDGQLNGPQGVSFTPGGDLLVADTGNARVQIFSDAGSHRRTLPARGAFNPMRRPRRAAAADDGTIYVADPGARRLFVISADGGTVRALASDAALEPADVALGRDGRLYVADAASRSLLVFQVM